MNDVQQAAFELRLADLRQLTKAGHDLSGSLLSACSAHDANTKSQQAVIRHLVKSGVSIHETDRNGVTPLHRAVRFRNLAAVKLLIELGANVNAKDRRSHSTPLHRAVTNTGAPATAGKGDMAVEIARVLLAHGADPKAKNKQGKMPADYVKRDAMKKMFGPLRIP